MVHMAIAVSRGTARCPGGLARMNVCRYIRLKAFVSDAMAAVSRGTAAFWFAIVPALRF